MDTMDETFLFRDAVEVSFNEVWDNPPYHYRVSSTFIDNQEFHDDEWRRVLRERRRRRRNKVSLRIDGRCNGCPHSSRGFPRPDHSLRSLMTGTNDTAAIMESPSGSPSSNPIPKPSGSPTVGPSLAPSTEPSETPTSSPSTSPADSPIMSPPGQDYDRITNSDRWKNTLDLVINKLTTSGLSAFQNLEVETICLIVDETPLVDKCGEAFERPNVIVDGGTSSMEPVVTDSPNMSPMEPTNPPRGETTDMLAGDKLHMEAPDGSG